MSTVVAARTAFPKDSTSLSGAPVESAGALLLALPLLRLSKHNDESAMNWKAAGLGFRASKPLAKNPRNQRFMSPLGSTSAR